MGQFILAAILLFLLGVGVVTAFRAVQQGSGDIAIGAICVAVLLAIMLGSVMA